MSENVELLRRLDLWDESRNPGPLIRWAAAHLRGCTAGTGDLGAAWAEAEAALPEGWLLEGVKLAGIAPSQVHAGWEATAIGKWNQYLQSLPIEHGRGPTPVAALRALTSWLQAGQA